MFRVPGGMIETNYQDSGDSSDKPSNTSTKTRQDLQKQHLKTLPNKKETVSNISTSHKSQNIPFEKKIPCSIKKNRGKSLFYGGERIDFYIFAPLPTGFSDAPRCSSCWGLPPCMASLQDHPHVIGVSGVQLHGTWRIGSSSGWSFQWWSVPHPPWK